jgi:hypothetical protein
MVRYVFREDAPLRLKGAKEADPQRIGEAIAEVAERQGGRLTPDAVVEAARSDESPLHPHFEWDNDAAAEAYRLDQARGIIRSIRVIEPKAEDGVVRAFVSVNDSGSSYRSIREVQTSSALQGLILRQAERDLEAWEKRYRQLTDICDLIRSARERLRRKRDGGERRAS